MSALEIPGARRHATLIELQTVYGLADLYLLLEIIAVDRHNEREAMKPRND